MIIIKISSKFVFIKTFLLSVCGKDCSNHPLSLQLFLLEVKKIQLYEKNTKAAPVFAHSSPTI